jgi:hypothetical protein
MGFMVLAPGKAGLVGRNDRNAARIGHLEQSSLGGAVIAMALQLNVEPVPEQLHERVAARLRERPLPGHDRLVERAAGAAGERDQAVGRTLKPGDLGVRPLGDGLSGRRAN